ncbi:MAG: hypothetical protein ACYDCD_02590 [Candidatus Acidiferrales bacterium]
MASLTVTTTSAKSNVVAMPSPVLEIPQSELESIIWIERRITNMQVELDQKRDNVKAMLQSGVRVAEGEHTASLKDTGRRTVAWREKAEELADRIFGTGRGAGWADNVMKHTAKSESWKVVVE